MMPALPTVVFSERRNALGNVRRLLAKQMLEGISVVTIIITETVWGLTFPSKHFSFLCFLNSKRSNFKS